MLNFLCLTTNLADHPVTMAMKDGRVTSSLVQLNYCGPKTAHDGFKVMLRAHAFDAGELAIVTYLQAKGATAVLRRVVPLSRRRGWGRRISWTVSSDAQTYVGADTDLSAPVARSNRGRVFAQVLPCNSLGGVHANSEPVGNTYADAQLLETCWNLRAR